VLLLLLVLEYYIYY